MGLICQQCPDFIMAHCLGGVFLHQRCDALQYGILGLLAGVEGVSGDFCQVLLRDGVTQLDEELQQHTKDSTAGVRVLAAGINVADVTAAVDRYVLHSDQSDCLHDGRTDGSVSVVLPLADGFRLDGDIQLRTVVRGDEFRRPDSAGAVVVFSWTLSLPHFPERSEQSTRGRWTGFPRGWFCLPTPPLPSLYLPLHLTFLVNH